MLLTTGVYPGPGDLSGRPRTEGGHHEARAAAEPALGYTVTVTAGRRLAGRLHRHLHHSGASPPGDGPANLPPPPVPALRRRAGHLRPPAAAAGCHADPRGGCLPGARRRPVALRRRGPRRPGRRPLARGRRPGPGGAARLGPQLPRAQAPACDRGRRARSRGRSASASPPAPPCPRTSSRPSRPGSTVARSLKIGEPRGVTNPAPGLTSCAETRR